MSDDEDNSTQSVNQEDDDGKYNLLLSVIIEDLSQ